jgi:hypothetical protein
MPAKVTIERLLRDSDDASGQTIRDWKIECEPGGPITIRMKHGDGFILMRTTDIDIFTSDLQRAKQVALSLHDQ